jgi:hypothetical protein
MSLSPAQEALCERLEQGESTPDAAALIREQNEIDNLWDRLSAAPTRLFVKSLRLRCSKGRWRKSESCLMGGIK